MIIRNKEVELYTETFGNQTNPAILMIAGSMLSGRLWTDTFCETLSKNDYFVIRYDNRDTGLSSSLPFDQNAYSVDDVATDAIAILDYFSINKAHIIGGSMGGLIAQLLALDYPERVLSITTIATAVFANAQAQMTPDELGRMVEQVQPLLANKPTNNLTESLSGWLDAWQSLHGDITIDKDLATSFITDMYQRTKPEHLAWLERLAQGLDPAHNHEDALNKLSDRTAELSAISIPVLVIHGDKDYFIPWRVVKEFFVDKIPHAEVHLIPDMGHVVFNQLLFQDLSTTIITFLKALPTQKA